MEPDLAQLSIAVPAAQSVERLVRPLLRLLGNALGLESTYLATVDLAAGAHLIRFSHNTGSLQVPEGLVSRWNDTLCKRALDAGHTAVSDVPQRWGDAPTARALGIQTFVSEPIRGEDGALLGTLCAASAQSRTVGPDAEALLKLFSGLVASLIERERLVAALHAANATLADYALRDALTGLPNRRALMDELQRLLARAQRENRCLLVGVVDLDDFKAINDHHGHQAGDRFLQAVATRLLASLRGGDLVGRLGGDEFLLLALGPGVSPASPPSRIDTGEPASAAQHWAERSAQACLGDYDLGAGLTLAYGGASVGVVALHPQGLAADAALREADARMYEVKRARKLAR
ncbi:sensor domain-containing diguanylate cyclase [Inhella crocodyli]|uniref:diguanylate cyclase n=1 Tax=Inhella crocodyli TaxID=2499851 RepID=A0A437LHR5_9BURK|nr:sensor domain-containing diguanylate cyclase [Inhella crocodyli]RVT84936.1 sensor domain-containing diguanylate cyclase [Inhella crocodyli]